MINLLISYFIAQRRALNSSVFSSHFCIFNVNLFFEGEGGEMLIKIPDDIRLWTNFLGRNGEKHPFPQLIKLICRLRFMYTIYFLERNGKCRYFWFQESIGSQIDIRDSLHVSIYRRSGLHEGKRFLLSIYLVSKTCNSTKIYFFSCNRRIKKSEENMSILKFQ